MQKVRLLTHRSDADAALAIVQRYGAMEFLELETPEQLTKSNEQFVHADSLPRLQHAIAFLEPYAPKVGLVKTLREGTQIELSEAAMTERLRDLDGTSGVITDVEAVQVELSEVTETIRQLEENRTALKFWKDLPIRIADLETATTRTYLVTSEKHEDSLESRLKSALDDSAITYELITIDDTAVALIVEKAVPVNDLVKTAGAEISSTPIGEEEPSIEIVAVEQNLAEAKGSQALLHDQAEHIAHTHLKNLQVTAELLGWQRDAHATKEMGAATKSTLVFEGWVKANKQSAIVSDLEGAELAAILEAIESAEDEEPPVEIENGTWTEPFEVVTRLYGMPGHKDLDPTAFLAGFFFLFFGLSLTDVGYGLFLMAVSLGLLFLAKVPRYVRTFAKLLFFMGLASASVGLLFGGYLGIAPEALPSWLLAVQLFDPIGNPLPVFYLALALGVFQIMVGMVLKIYSEYRNNRLMTGLLDQGPWLVMFFILIGYLAATLGYVTFISTDQIVNLIYVGIVVIVLASGRKGDTILQKVQSAALSLYDSIGYFSDILSYSRLLALGLATTALAFAVNLIAEIVAGSVPYLGPVLALLVLIVGHLFTLAVNTLGAFIHSARLQFVEFFGKFIGGTGRQFTPLARSEKHVVAINDE